MTGPIKESVEKEDMHIKINNMLHYNGCSGNTPHQYYGEERTSGGICAVIFTTCPECNIFVKHHFSVVGEGDGYWETLEKLEDNGVTNLPA